MLLCATALLACPHIQVSVAVSGIKYSTFIQDAARVAAFTRRYQVEVSSLAPLASLGITPDEVKVQYRAGGTSGHRRSSRSRSLLQSVGGGGQLVVDTTIGPFPLGVTPALVDAATAQVVSDPEAALSPSFKADFGITAVSAAFGQNLQVRPARRLARQLARASRCLRPVRHRRGVHRHAQPLHHHSAVPSPSPAHVALHHVLALLSTYLHSANEIY